MPIRLIVPPIFNDVVLVVVLVVVVRPPPIISIVPVVHRVSGLVIEVVLAVGVHLVLLSAGVLAIEDVPLVSFCVLVSKSQRKGPDVIETRHVTLHLQLKVIAELLAHVALIQPEV